MLADWRLTVKCHSVIISGPILLIRRPQAKTHRPIDGGQTEAKKQKPKKTIKKNC